jgi:hypothetical protein
VQLAKAGKVVHALKPVAVDVAVEVARGRAVAEAVALDVAVAVARAVVAVAVGLAPQGEADWPEPAVVAPSAIRAPHTDQFDATTGSSPQRPPFVFLYAYVAPTVPGLLYTPGLPLPLTNVRVTLAPAAYVVVALQAGIPLQSSAWAPAALSTATSTATTVRP